MKGGPAMADKRKPKNAGRRSNGDGTIRRRSDGTWEGRYSVGTNPGDGKLIRKSVYGRTRPEVAEKLRAATADVDQGTYLDPTRLTVRQWFEIWLTEYMAAVKPLTVQQYRSMSESHIFPALGAVKLSKLTAPQLQKFYNQLAVDGKKKRRKNPDTGEMETVSAGEPLSAKTIRNIYDIMSKALNVAVSQGMIRENVNGRTTVPKVIRKEVKPLDEEMQRRFIDALDGHKYRDLFLVYLFCGLRESEAIGLTWDCVDFRTGTLKVYRQWQRIPGNWSEFHFVLLKNDKSRKIRLSPFVLDIFTREYRTQFPDDGRIVDYQELMERMQKFIFTDQKGRPLNPAPVYENFKKLAAGIGIPEARLHDLRHTFAVNSLSEGDSPKTVQENLGHHSAAFTLDVYGHVTEKMREESAQRQQAMIERMGIKMQRDA